MLNAGQNERLGKKQHYILHIRRTTHQRHNKLNKLYNICNLLFRVSSYFL